MAYETLLVETRGRVGLVTLNRPQALNALNRQLLEELKSVLSVACPVLIMKLQCIGDICAPPIIMPRQPASSMSFQAEWPSGFLKVEPPVFSRIGWVVSRRLVISLMRAKTASGASTAPR